VAGGVRSDAGKVVTVGGPIDPDRLGVTLVHEHLLLDGRVWQQEPATLRQRALCKESIRMDFLGDVRRDALVFEDNLVLDDPELARQEVLEFRALGGSTIVDVTCCGIGRDVRSLAMIQQEAGINIIAGCGYYVQPSHPPEVSRTDVDGLTELLLLDLLKGIDGSRIRAGVIGEIGTSATVHRDEWKVLTAACAAQRESGVALSVHVHPMQGTTAPEVVGHILGQGVDPARVIICHMDGNMDLEYQLGVAETGVYISYDCFGLELYFDSLNSYRCHDSERERLLLQLLEHGYGRQLLLSHDVCYKVMLKHYGGYGYDHLLRHIVPSLCRNGVSRETIDLLLVENPRRALTITSL